MRVSSIKYVMEKINLASIKWSNEEFDKKLIKMRHELDLNDKKIIEYEAKIKDLNRQLKAYKIDHQVRLKKYNLINNLFLF